jgi:hypothetical protein
MKPLITLLAAIWILNTNGQTYHKLLETNKFWTVETVDYIEVPPVVNQYVYSYSKDTLINSKVYQNFKNETFLREDTIERKVFMYKEGGVNKECLLYDFSAKKGDTIEVCSFVISIDSVSTFQISTGEIRNIFYYSGTVFPAYYMEGIGSNKGFVTLSEPIGPPSINLICVKQGTTEIYGEGCEGTNPINSVTSYSKVIKVYPVPADNFLNVECNETVSSYKIFDLFGKTIWQDKLRDTKIELTNIKPGFYIIEFIKSNNQVIGSRNLIIKN